MFTLPRIYPITDTLLSRLSHAEQVAQFIDGGATFIQLREKFAAPDEFYTEAKKAVEIAHARGAQVLINDRADIALALKADGVHLGQDDLPPAEARKLLGENAIIGFSTHDLTQAALAAHLPIDYIAFGPVFPTTTKENPDPVTGLRQLSQVKEAVGDIPLAAIGGITEEDLPRVFAARANSAALISALLTGTDSISITLNRLMFSN